MSWKDYKSRINRKVFFKLLDNSFNDKKELFVETEKEQKEILLELRKHIKSCSPEKANSWDYRFSILTESLSERSRRRGSVTGRVILEYYSIYDDFTMRNYLIVETEASSHTRQELYMVIFFKDKILNIEFPIYEYEYSDKKLEELTVRFDKYKTTKNEVIKFIDDLMKKQKELEIEAKNKEIKKEKITVLKSKTIKAKVKEIMKDKNMVYRFEEKRNKIILIIKQSQSQVTEITITYKKFQNTLKNLSSFLDKLIELYEQDISVKHRQTNSINYYKWIESSAKN